VLVDGSEGVPEVVFRDLAAEDNAGDAREAVVQPGPESRVDDLVIELLEDAGDVRLRCCFADDAPGAAATSTHSRRSSRSTSSGAGSNEETGTVTPGFAEGRLDFHDAGPDVVVVTAHPSEIGGPEWPAETAPLSDSTRERSSRCRTTAPSRKRCAAK
jgi:hypothetical protein